MARVVLKNCTIDEYTAYYRADNDYVREWHFINEARYSINKKLGTMVKCGDASDMEVLDEKELLEKYMNDGPLEAFHTQAFTIARTTWQKFIGSLCSDDDKLMHIMHEGLIDVVFTPKERYEHPTASTRVRYRVEFNFAFEIPLSQVLVRLPNETLRSEFVYRSDETDGVASQIKPLYELFTTKEDRFAIYKLMQKGLQPRKGAAFGGALKVWTYFGIDTTKLFPAVHADRVALPSKIATVARTTGVSALQLKQVAFCGMLAENSIKSDAKPFLCKDEQEIDRLGKATFGELWDERMGGGERVKYTFDCSGEEQKECLDLLDDKDVLPIQHPFVYPETIPADERHYGAYAPCTIFACWRAASAVELLRNLNGRYFGLSKSFLKAYLNGKCAEEDRERARALDCLFYAFLVFYRMYMTPFGLRDSNNDIMFSPLTGFHDVISCVVDNGGSYLRKGPFDGCFSQMLKIFFCYGVESCSYYYRGRSSVHVSNTFIDEDDPSLRQFGIYSLCEERIRFLVDDLILPSLKQTDYTSLLVDGNILPASATQDRFLVVILDYNFKLDGRPGQGICWGKRDTGKRTCLTSFLNGIPRKVVPEDALIYTTLLVSQICKRYKPFRLTSGNIPAETCILVTQSCYISLLRREIKCYIPLKFAFRNSGSAGDSPLVIYVDNDDDAELVRREAESVGAELNGTDNAIVMLTPQKKPEKLEELFCEDDLKRDDLATELVKVFLLLNVTFGKISQPSCCSGGIRYFLEKTDSECGGRCLFKTTGTDGDLLTRCLVPTETLAIRDGYVSDAISLNCDASKLITYSLTTRERVTEGGVSSDKDCIMFVPYNLDYEIVMYLPVVIKDSYCMYIRWREIPALLPSLKEAWGRVESMPVTRAWSIAGTLLKREGFDVIGG